MYYIGYHLTGTIHHLIYLFVHVLLQTIHIDSFDYDAGVDCICWSIWILVKINFVGGFNVCSGMSLLRHMWFYYIIFVRLDFQTQLLLIQYR